MSDVQNFADLDLIKPLVRAVAQEGYKTPTPIQARCIPVLLKGRDLLGCAQTGTGKTAAFALPILQNMQKSGARTRHIRTLVMTPTRELAAQIHESFQTYGRGLSLTSTVIFGGVPQKGQEKALRHGPDILVATPGRLLDLMGQKFVNLKHVEYFILDEADRMLDMGFIHDVRRVIDVLPAKRQNLFFSATMPPAVTELADRMLTDPVQVRVASKSPTADRIDQKLMYVDKGDKCKLLETLLKDAAIHRALVFSRTKHGADRICRDLVRGDIAAGAIHSNKSQNARTQALAAFRKGKYRVLVATDIAARGIDVDDVSHVINFDLPNEPESYVHRIGRTARAGRAGKAISFCAGDEREYLREIEKILKRQVPVDTKHDFHSDEASMGMENGAPAMSPGKKKAREQAGQARRRQELKTGTARPTRGRRQGPGGNSHVAKAGAKTGAKAQESRGATASGSGKSRRRRRTRSTG